MSVDIDKVLAFLSQIKTRSEIEEHFNLSNMQSHRLVVWLIKGGYARTFSGRMEGKAGNKKKFYVRMKCAWVDSRS